MSYLGELETMNRKYWELISKLPEMDLIRLGASISKEPGHKDVLAKDGVGVITANMAKL
jgi:hypothetical protein